MLNYAIFQSLEKEANLILPILVKVSNLSLGFRKQLTAQEMDTKSDYSPVTIYDFVIQILLVNSISSKFPNDPIIAEESLKGIHPHFLEQIQQHLDPNIDIQQIFEKVSKSVKPNTNRFWTIDPIDGTSGFKHYTEDPQSQNQYAIAVALIENNDVVFSAVAWPGQTPYFSGLEKAEPTFFLAARNIGSFYTTQTIFDASDDFTLPGENHGGFIRVTAPSNPVPRQTHHESRNREIVAKMKEIAKRLGMEYNVLDCTSMVKGFCLALGTASYYVRVPYGEPEAIYDIAPFSMFIEEAGGFATTGDGRKLVFDHNGRVVGTDTGVVFSNRGAEFHEKLVDIYCKAFRFHKAQK